MSSSGKPDNLFATVTALGRLGLVLLGLVGIMVHMFRESGWLYHLIDRLFASTAWLLALPVLLFALYIINAWLSTVPSDGHYKRGDIPLYIMMGMGAFFLGKLVLTGRW